MSNPHSNYIRWFDQISADDVPLVGGKNASLGEMYSELNKEGISVPFGFAVTATAYWHFLESAGIKQQIHNELSLLNKTNILQLKDVGKRVRALILKSAIPQDLQAQIQAAYETLCERSKRQVEVAVRSSATAEDLPGASFAGQQETYLNISGEHELIEACKKSFASLFTDRAISYRVDMGFDHMQVALSIGVQEMVRSDLASAGVIFTIDTESGFSDVVLITASYGLGENIVKGNVVPDEHLVFKPTLKLGFKPIISSTLGSKKIKMIYGESDGDTTKNVLVAKKDRGRFVLSENEITKLSRWAVQIEEHYSKRAGQHVPMDIEWAKDGVSGDLFIVQARPETVVAGRKSSALVQYKLQKKGKLLLSGQAVGQAIGSGLTHVIHSAHDIEKFQKGQVLVTEATDPDWEPIMKIAAAVVTEKGGRTSHAAIVSRELGIPCIVGAKDACEKLDSGTAVTVSCAEGSAGRIYEGLLPFEKQITDLEKIPQTRTQIMLNVGNPESAFDLSFLPNDGVGLTRIEFIISTYIQAHPLALIGYDDLKDHKLKKQISDLTVGFDNKSDFFVEKLAQGIGKIAAAFYPKAVIVRLSDFKTNEYAHLLGGESFEPKEENPMLGWRGASRYYHPDYKAGFRLECAAIKKAREIFGLKNIKVMVPFCRTVSEAKNVIDVMAQNGLKQGENALEIYGMCEIPANVILAQEFLEVFDGFSIGSNDLTQLTLGIDRDSEIVANLFDERNPAVLKLISQVIEVAEKKGKYIGICGDAPSTYPEFAAFLLQAGIKSISLSPDAAISGRLLIAQEEERLAGGSNADNKARNIKEISYVS